ncbi:heme exporter protein CcmD [Rhizobium leguminosarum]|uniref:heme exporter protein CcmD n=1 Tax=Rhizobium leguminosarum TaxID=384 RepID=UPI001440F2E6|nr:heme exporter protein CcmD [Rhizobium leguminosarum]MBY5820618.1 heme exporter protein CcmD [Rhizobium leguminosarum]NKL79001.1 heme exporter protein CcmD [Rhizobium leguminosarum bv. viciae]
MTHQAYVYIAYALTFSVVFATSAKVWITGRSYRRRVAALAPVRAVRTNRGS